MGPGSYYLGEEEKESLCLAIENKEISRYMNNKYSCVDKFEQKVCEVLDSKYCLGMNSCTSALYTGIKFSGINPGDEVIVPSYTFVATVAAVVLNGAIPIFANIDESFCIDVNDAAKKITKKTKAIIAVHMLGNPCNMDELTNLCEKNNLLLIEDVAQAFGGSYKKQMLGTFGLFGAFSLNCFKIITAGDGGFFTTSDDNLYHKVFAFHDHGFYESNNRIITENSIFGLNLRMHELTGCVAFEQIKKGENILQSLRHLKRIFKETLGTNTKFKYRTINDINGECSNVTILTFENEILTQKFCKHFNTQSMIQSKKHCYDSMIPILKKELSDYTFDKVQMKKTDELLSKSVIISTGMSDSYIGADIGYNVKDSEETVVKKAEEIQKYIIGM